MPVRAITAITGVVAVMVAGVAGCAPQSGALQPPAQPAHSAVASPTPSVELPGVPVSSACSSALEEMKGGYDALYALPTYTDEEADALELPPLDACRTAAEYIEGARQNPAALGLTRASCTDPERC